MCVQADRGKGGPLPAGPVNRPCQRRRRRTWRLSSTRRTHTRWVTRCPPLHSVYSIRACPFISEGYLRRPRPESCSHSSRCRGHGAGGRLVTADLSACVGVFSVQAFFRCEASWACPKISFQHPGCMNNSTTPSRHTNTHLPPTPCLFGPLWPAVHTQDSRALPCPPSSPPFLLGLHIFLIPPARRCCYAPLTSRHSSKQRALWKYLTTKTHIWHHHLLPIPPVWKSIFNWPENECAIRRSRRAAWHKII